MVRPFTKGSLGVKPVVRRVKSSSRSNPNQTHTSPQEPNLIMLTPPPGKNAFPQLVPERHVSKPKKQRSPRRRKARSEWQLNQRQFEQNQSQEISHILPQEPIVPEVFNVGEEPSVSYLQLPTRNRLQQEDNQLCT